MILLDRDMPLMDGVQFCATLDQTLRRDGTVIVAMTASGRLQQFQAACRADDSLPKPFDLDDLLHTVERLLPTG